MDADSKIKCPVRKNYGPVRINYGPVKQTFCSKITPAFSFYARNPYFGHNNSINSIFCKKKIFSNKANL